MAAEKSFTIPATPKAAIEKLAELAEDIERIELIRFEMELSQLRAMPVSATRNAKEVGLRMRYAGNRAWRFIEGGMTIEEFAESIGSSVLMVETYFEATGFFVTDEDEAEDEDEDEVHMR